MSVSTAKMGDLMVDTVQEVEAEAPEYLRPPEACGDEFEKVTWTGTVAVHVKDALHLGVRFNDERLQRLAVDALGERVASDLLEAPPLFSVKVGTPGRRKAAPLHFLYLGVRPVLGTRDLPRLMSGLANHVGAHLPREREGHVVDAIPVMTPRGLLLVPQEILSMAGAIDRVLTPAGFRFADVPRVELDLENAEVIIPEPAVDFSLSPEEAAKIAPTIAQPRLEPGRYPLAGWLLSVAASRIGRLSHASAVLYVSRLLETPFPSGAQATLEGVVSLTSRVPATGITWSTHDEMVDVVLAAGQV